MVGRAARGASTARLEARSSTRAARRTSRRRRPAACPACAAAAALTAGRCARRNGLVARSSPIVEGTRRLAAIALGLLARLRAPAGPRCPARPPARSEGSRACTRARNRRASRAAARRAPTATSTSAAACPRTGGRSPPANSVSPQKSDGRAADVAEVARCGRRCGRARRCTSKRTRRVPARRSGRRRASALRAPGNRLARGSEHGHRRSARAAPGCRRRGRRDDASRGWRVSASPSRSRYVEHRRGVARIDDGRRRAPSRSSQM